MRPIYKSYVFRDKDPLIYTIWDAIKDRPLPRVANESGVAVSTLHNWFFGTTARPQAATARAVLRSQGLDLAVVQSVQALPEPVVIKAPERPRRVKHLKVINGGKSKDQDGKPFKKDKEPLWKKIRAKHRAKPKP